MTFTVYIVYTVYTVGLKEIVYFFFLQCLRYIQQRDNLSKQLNDINVPFQMNCILYGSPDFSYNFIIFLWSVLLEHLFVFDFPNMHCFNLFSYYNNIFSYFLIIFFFTVHYRIAR